MSGSEWTQSICIYLRKMYSLRAHSTKNGRLKMGGSSMWRPEERDTLYLSCLVVYFVLEMATLYEITHFASVFPILPLENIGMFWSLLVLVIFGIHGTCWHALSPPHIFAE